MAIFYTKCRLVWRVIRFIFADGDCRREGQRNRTLTNYSFSMLSRKSSFNAARIPCFLTLSFDVSRLNGFIATCPITPRLYLITTQVKFELRDRSGISGVLRATYASLRDDVGQIEASI